MPKKKYILSKEFQKESSKGICKAIDLVYGVDNLAKLLGVSRQIIYHWRTGKVCIPINRALEIEKKIPEITVKELRPDLFEKEC